MCGACVTYGGEEKCAQGDGGKLVGKSYWGDTDVDGRMILRCVFRKLVGVVGTGWSWLRIRTGGGNL
jgi:hypothetical protein